MKVKLIVPRAGVGFSQNVGDIIDVEAKEGARLIEAGQASAVRASKKKVEKAVKQ